MELSFLLYGNTVPYTKVMGSIPGWGMYERQPVNGYFSLTSMFFSLPLPLSLKSINISSGGALKKFFLKYGSQVSDADLLLVLKQVYPKQENIPEYLRRLSF